jgi:hypothetical protein
MARKYGKHSVPGGLHFEPFGSGAIDRPAVDNEQVTASIRNTPAAAAKAGIGHPKKSSMPRE